MNGCSIFSLKAGRKERGEERTREETGEKELLLLATRGQNRKDWFSVKQVKAEIENVLYSVIPKVGGRQKWGDT